MAAPLQSCSTAKGIPEATAPTLMEKAEGQITKNYNPADYHHPGEGKAILSVFYIYIYIYIYICTYVRGANHLKCFALTLMIYPASYAGKAPRHQTGIARHPQVMHEAVGVDVVSS